MERLTYAGLSEGIAPEVSPFSALYVKCPIRMSGLIRLLSTPILPVENGGSLSHCKPRGVSFAVQNWGTGQDRQ